MKINFTKKEYKSLIEALDITNWIINSFRGNFGFGGESKKHVELANKIHSYAEEIGCEEHIKPNESVTGCRLRVGTENTETRAYIEQFVENSFWLELANKLAERDVLNKYSVLSLSDIPTEERIDMLCEAENKWEDEFDKYGLERIGIAVLKLLH
jgi:hypothetical protein